MTVEHLGKRFEISGRRLVRNGILNIIGQALPLLIGLASVPVILRGLGPDRFGLLVFSWTLIGAFTVFDLGLGAAVTKFVAEALGSGDVRGISGIVWSAVAAQAILGTVGAGMLIATVDPLVLHFLNVPTQIQAEAIAGFKIVGLILPVMLLINSFRGVVEAAQRFDIAAWVKGGSSASNFLIPLAGVLLRWDLPQIIVMLLAVRILLLVGLFFACLRILPILKRSIHVTASGLRRLRGFGGWITVSGLVGFAITYGDRFVIGHSLTMAALTHYTVPLELISRLGLIAATFAAVLLPAFSTLGGAGDRPRMSLLFGRSVKYVLLTMAPVFGVLAVFAPDILRIWLGPDTAAQSSSVLRILSVGAAFQVLAVIPATLIQGLGRPDLQAKFYLVQTPLYLLVLRWLVGMEGIRGAALAWSGRLVFESIILLWATGQMGVWSWQSGRRAVGRVIFPVAAVCALSVLLYSLPATLGQRVIMVVGLMLVFGWWIWKNALESEERRWMLGLATGWRRMSVTSATARPQH